MKVFQVASFISKFIFVGVCYARTISFEYDLEVTRLSPKSILERTAKGLLKPQVKRKVASPISVAVSQYWDGNDGPWSSFVLQVGNRSQEVRVLPSTASSSTWVVYNDPGCNDVPVPNCASSRGKTFNPNTSSTWTSNLQWSIYELGVEENLLGRKVYGEYAYETITLGHLGGGGPSVQRSVVAGIGDTHFSWLGVLGINPRPINFTNMPNLPQPSLLQLLKNQNDVPSLSWAYTAGARYKPSPVFGSLVLGGYDTSRFRKPPDTDPDLTFPFNTDVDRDLLVGISSITASSTLNTTSSAALLTKGIYAVIDSTIPHLWLPQKVCDEFENAFGLQWDSDTELYKLSREQHIALLALNPSVIINVTPSLSSSVINTSVAITLPYSAFDLNVSWPYGNGPFKNESAYYFPLKRATDLGQYTLGRAFLQEAYVIADYERHNFSVWPCRWDDKTTNETFVSILPHEHPDKMLTSKKLGIGAIIGIVVGGVAIMVLLSLVVWIFLRRRSRARTSSTELQQIEPTPADAAAPSLPPYPKKFSTMTELAGTEKYELHEDHRFEAESGERYEMNGQGLPHEADGTEKRGLYEMDSGYDGVGLVDSHGAVVRIIVEPPTAVTPKLQDVLLGSLEKETEIGSEMTDLKSVKEKRDDAAINNFDKKDEKYGVRSFFGFLKAFRASGKA